jgi:PIN domain nuclease of toxin-antitoxin system
MAVLLDTCTWVWWCASPKKLSVPAREAIEREIPSGTLRLSMISVWEVAKLVEKRKLAFSIPCRQWIEHALSQEGLQICPLTPEICVDSTELPGAFHGDPADQVIVATARALSAVIVTCDRKIRDYPHVATLW